MRIAVWDDPPPGGAPRAMHELIYRLARRHVVDRFVLDAGEMAPALAQGCLHPWPRAASPPGPLSIGDGEGESTAQSAAGPAPLSIGDGEGLGVRQPGPCAAPEPCVDNSPDASGATRSEPGAVRVLPIPFHPRTHRPLGLYWNDWLTLRDLLDLERLERALARRIDAGGYDVALVSVLGSGQVPAALAYLRTPAAYYCHQPPLRAWEPFCRPQAAPLTAWERWRLRWRWPTRALIERWNRARDRRNARAAKLILTNSRYTREQIRAVYRRDAEVCYLGVDAERFRPAQPHQPIERVVSVGALEAHKGFDFVIRALAKVPAERRPALTLVGSSGHPRMPAHLARLAADAGVRLTVRQGLSHPELAEIYRESAIFVFGAHREPFGLVLLEAMASGLPVVAVDEGGVAEVVEAGVTGLLTPRDETAFAAALDLLLRDADRRQAMGATGRARVEQRWSWDGAVARLEERLSALATPRGPGESLEHR